MYKTVKYIGTIAILFFCGMQSLSSQSLLNKSFEARSRANERIYRLTENSAAYALLPLQKEVRVSTEFISGKSNDAALHNIYDGNAYRFGEIKADGYAADSAGTLVSGKAAYITGVQLGTAWTDVADHEIFYPYLVADSIGGDYFSENYIIEGAYGRKINKLILSGQLHYRGGIAYRKIDPRPQNDMSEIKFGLGGVYPIRNYSLGTFVNYSQYKQRMEISSLKPDRKDRFFSMKGLGLFDYQLSETSANFGRYFFMHQWQTGFHISRKDRSGLVLFLSIINQNIKEDAGNERFPYEIKRLKPHLDISYQWQLSPKHILQLEGSTQLSMANGTENHYDTVIVHKDPLIIAYEKSYSAMKHTLNTVKTTASVLYEYRCTPQQHLWTKFESGYFSYDEKYLYPEYKMSAANFWGQATLGYGKNLGNSWFDVHFRAGKVFPLQSNIAATAESKIVDRMLYPQYSYLKAGNYSFAAHIDFHTLVARKTLLGLSTYAATKFNHKNRIDWGISLSVNFI